MGSEHLALVGPTASGKSALAVAVAQRLGDVEIVSLDAMQVYRGMDVGTAKPSSDERAAVPHHLIDVVDASGEWSIAALQGAARRVIGEVEERGRRALMVGGSGLHVRAVLDDLRFPGEDRVLRAQLESLADTTEGLAEMWDELRRADPDAASRIERGNVRRLVRALEVIRLTGKPFSGFGDGMRRYGETFVRVRMAGVWLPRAVVALRIEQRLATMREAGFLEEVAALREVGLSRTARQAIGYREVLAHLDSPSSSLGQVFEAIAARTRRFARRQRVWFRRDPRISWYGAASSPADAEAALLGDWSA